MKELKRILKKKLNVFLNNEKGSISIFLILILIGVLFVLFVLIDTYRIKYASSKLSSSTELASYSILAGYNRELKDEYGLYAVLDLDKHSISKKIEDNIYEISSDKDMTKLNDIKVNLTEVKSLGDISELNRQIQSHMKYNMKEVLFNKALEKYKELDNLKVNMDNAKKENEDIKNEKVSVPTEEEYETIKDKAEDDPRDKIKEKEDEFNNSTNEEYSLSKDIIKEIKESGESKDLDSAKVSLNLKEKIYLNEYIFKTFTHKLQDKKRLYNSEIEFILGNDYSEKKNIKYIKNEIIKQRTIVNLIEIYSDENLKTQVYVMSQAIGGWWATEVGVQIIKNTILVSMAVDRSIDDVKSLLDGEKIELFKESNITFDYGEYLYFLCYLKSDEHKLKRINELITINLKEVNVIFNMNDTITGFKANAVGNTDYMFMPKLNIYKENLSNSMNFNIGAKSYVTY